MLNHIALCDDLLMRESEISLGNSPSRPDTNYSLTTHWNYELKQFTSGVSVYSIKPDASHSTPTHYLCSNCFDVHRKKSIIQPVSQFSNKLIYLCPNCSFKFIS